MANYANLPKASQKGKDGGYKPALWFSPVEDIATWQRPIAIPLVVGDKVKIVTAHTWAVGKAAYKWDAKIHSTKITAATVGDEGSGQIEHTAELVILGDNPEIYEQVLNSLNDDKVVFLKDPDCITNDSYIQLGDDCVPVTVTWSFDSFTTAEGQKAWTMSIKSRKKFFYLAALDETV
jgi:hypothetical protein